LASEFPPNFHHLLKRQDTCDTQCDPIGDIAATCTADACYCPTFVSYGPACSSCYLTLNATLASEIGVVVTDCESEFPTLKPGTATATPTPTANTAVPCTSQCDPIANIASTCTLDTCYCPTFASYGPACSACYLSINATLAAEIGEVVTACASEVSEVSTTANVATTPATATAVPCTSQCNAVDNIAATCTAASCFCPTFISYGSACSSCYATINATLASELGNIITGCQIEFSTTAKGGSTPTPTTNGGGGATTCTQCDVIADAASSCSDDACFCPTLASLGPACSSCLQPINATAAFEVASILSICTSEFPNLASGGSVPTQTSAQPTCTACSSINAANTICSNNACFCASILQYGGACSVCLQTISPAQAADVGSAISSCGTAPVTTSPITLIGSGATGSVHKSGSGARGMRISFAEFWTYAVLGLSFVAGVIVAVL